MSNHLVTKHGASPGQIKSCFTQIGDMRMEHGKKKSVSKRIGDYFVPRRRMEDKSACNEVMDNDPSVPS